MPPRIDDAIKRRRKNERWDSQLRSQAQALCPRFMQFHHQTGPGGTVDQRIGGNPLLLQGQLVTAVGL